jgi:hypothetical protein
MIERLPRRFARISLLARANIAHPIPAHARRPLVFTSTTHSIHFIRIVSHISKVLLSMIERLPRRFARISLLARANIAHPIPAHAISPLVLTLRLSRMRNPPTIQISKSVMKRIVGKNFRITIWSNAKEYLISRNIRLVIFAIIAIMRTPFIVS